MNTKTTLAAITVVACGFNATLNAAEKPWYVNATINQADLTSLETQSTEQVAGISRRLDIDTDDETGFGLTIGHSIFTQSNGNNLSLELNYSATDHNINEIRFMDTAFISNDGAAEGSLEIETVLARLKYQFNSGQFKPYLGLGIGQSDIAVDARYGMSVGSSITSQPPFATGSASETALELRGGIEYEINDSIGVFIEYSLTDVSDIDFTRLGGGPGGLTTTTQQGDYDIDSVNLGLNVHF